MTTVFLQVSPAYWPQRGAVALFPFGIYHLLWNSTPVALLTLGLCLILAVIAALVSERKYALLAAHLLVILNSIVGLAVFWMLGMQASYWLFVLITANYFMLPLRSALIINALVIAGSLPVVAGEPDPGIRYLVSIILVSLLPVFSLSEPSNRKRTCVHKCIRIRLPAR
jgi:phosphatidylglycerophosphatase A